MKEERRREITEFVSELVHQYYCENNISSVVSAFQDDIVDRPGGRTVSGIG